VCLSGYRIGANWVPSIWVATYVLTTSTSLLTRWWPIQQVGGYKKHLPRVWGLRLTRGLRSVRAIDITSLLRFRLSSETLTLKWQVRSSASSKILDNSLVVHQTWLFDLTTVREKCTAKCIYQWDAPIWYRQCCTSAAIMQHVRNGWPQHHWPERQ
jgi:hypothetical protein